MQVKHLAFSIIFLGGDRFQQTMMVISDGNDIAHIR